MFSSFIKLVLRVVHNLIIKLVLRVVHNLIIKLVLRVVHNLIWINILTFYWLLLGLVLSNILNVLVFKASIISTNGIEVINNETVHNTNPQTDVISTTIWTQSCWPHTLLRTHSTYQYIFRCAVDTLWDSYCNCTVLYH
jgi:hypothetical protein